MLEQRRRRWADVVQMLYKCFVFAGLLRYCAEHNLHFIWNNNTTFLQILVGKYFFLAYVLL